MDLVVDTKRRQTIQNTVVSLIISKQNSHHINLNYLICYCNAPHALKDVDYEVIYDVCKEIKSRKPLQLGK
jgi:hypothetical protein